MGYGFNCGSAGNNPQGYPLRVYPQVGMISQYGHIREYSYSECTSRASQPSSSASSSPTTSDSFDTFSTSSFLISPSKLQAPRQSSARDDCVLRREWRWERMCPPRLKSCSTSIDVAGIVYQSLEKHFKHYITHQVWLDSPRPFGTGEGR